MWIISDIGYINLDKVQKLYYTRENRLFPKEGYKYRWHIDYSENNYDEVWLTEEENNVLVEYLSRIKNNIKKNK
ncbi:MAG: hypothetical protein LBL60_01365 [Mycoplasmataceae bacterium]|nr:hypothetical protein [Mycoplasmataceae bacterium]